MDVIAAGEQESVEPLHEVRNGGVDPGNGHRDPAGPGDRPAVVLVQDVQVPGRLLLDVHGDADQRLHWQTSPAVIVPCNHL
jgi:hypothetical protein